MPTDVYVNTGQTAGEQTSSGGEGRVLTFAESTLTHPYHADGFVDGGDPVFYGDTVGIARSGAAAATDLIAIDTEGIRWLNVLGSVSDGTADGLAQALTPGQRVYIKKVPSTDTYILSGQSDPMNFQPFGITLSAVTSSLTVPTLVAVKVHQERNDWLHVLLGARDDELLLEGDSALRAQTWLKGFLGPVAFLGTAETITAMNFRITTMQDEDVGTLNGMELKVHHDYAGRLAAMHPLKLNIDSGGGGADLAYGMEILAEGAGTAHSVLTGIRFHQKGTDGTLQAPFRNDAVDTDFGIVVRSTTAPSKTTNWLEIPWLYGDTLYWLIGYDTIGT